MTACSGVVTAVDVVAVILVPLRAVAGAVAADTWREASVDGLCAVLVRIAVCGAAMAIAALAGVLVAEPADVCGAMVARATVCGTAKTAKVPDELFAGEFFGVCGAAFA